MANARARRHDAEIVEGGLAPFQEAIALAIALIFELDIGLERFLGAELVDDDRMVDDEIDRHQRIDLLRIAAERDESVAHRREIDDGRHAGEILHQHARRAEGDLTLGLALLGQPFGEALDMLLGDRAAVLVAQQILEQHAQRIGQARDALEPIGLGRLQREIMIGVVSDLERLEGFETVERRHGNSSQRANRAFRVL